MRRLEIFKDDYRKIVFMPDGVETNWTEYGVAFYVPDNPSTILKLPNDWGYIWIDKLEND